MSTEVIKFKNPTDQTLKLRSLGLPDVAPNGEIDVPVALAAPTRRDNGSRGASAIEKCAPQLVPVDPVVAEVWKQVPDPLPPKSLVVSTQRRDPDEPAGVKALRVAAKTAKTEKPAEKASEPQKPVTPPATQKVGG